MNLLEEEYGIAPGQACVFYSKITKDIKFWEVAGYGDDLFNYYFKVYLRCSINKLCNIIFFLISL